MINDSSKINLCFYSTLFQSANIQNDPIYNLIFNYDEIKMILNSNAHNIIKILYFNIIKIEQILYDKEEDITINSDEIKNELFYYFYLDLLIENNPDLQNYKYEFDLINKINEQQKQIDKKEIFKKILISKIIIELINNYRSYDEENKENELNIIENYNKKFINDNIKIFNNLSLNWTVNDILNKKIDLIYIKILIALNKYDFNNIFIINNSETLILQKIDIIKQLDIENIDITKTMFDKLSIELNSDNIYSNYNIKVFNDLFNDKKIIFFFELFKYILKKQIYVFQIDFLLKTRKNIKKIIKSNIQKFLETYHQQSENVKNKIKYILEFIFEFDYYLTKLNLNEENIELRNQNNPKTTNPISDIENENENINNNNFNQNINDIIIKNKQSFNQINEILINEENDNYGNLNSKVSNPLTRSTVSDAHKSSNRKLEIDKNSKNEEKEIEELNEILNKTNFKFKYIENDFSFYEIKFGVDGKNININQINEKKLNNQYYVLYNSYTQFLKFLDNFEDKIKHKFNNNYNLEGELIFEKYDKDIDFTENKNLFKIECKYKFRIPNNDDEYAEFHDENVLFKFVDNNNDLEKLEGFINFLNEINHEIYRNI